MCLKGIRHVWSHAYIFICVQLTLTKVGALCSEGEGENVSKLKPK